MVVARGRCPAVHLIATKTPSVLPPAKPKKKPGISASSISVRDVFSDDHGPWRYDTVIAHTDSDAGAHAANAESDDLRWVLLGEVAEYHCTWGAWRRVARPTPPRSRNIEGISRQGPIR